ncbi:MAG: hypothetical protein ACRD21_21240 [Vicinamibacteria bacterium]
MRHREFRSRARALAFLAAWAAGCQRPAEEAEGGAKPLSRTEFTERIENFFEYDPLRAGRPSQFRIHLTELSEGSPVAGADVSLRLLSESVAVVESEARAGKVAGIYLAEVTPSSPGSFDVEFRVRTSSLDETMRLSGFSVEP